MATSKKRTKARTGKKNKKSRQWIRYLLLAFLILGLFFVYKVFGPNTGAMADGNYLYIRTGSSYEQVKPALKQGGFVRDIASFDLLAKRVGYTTRVRPGRYKIEKGMSNYAIIRMLRAGRQEPVRLVINKLRTKDDFVRLVSAKLEADSNALRFILNDNNYLSQFGLDSNTAMCAVMPDTYEYYWNTTADSAFKKLARRYTRFWTAIRKEKAQKLGLTPQEAIILASIVSEETEYNPEKATIASVYLNRLKKGMKLQADPTAKFAYGDFTVKRITATHTSIQSPYNTYYTQGLPPGPICTPTSFTIDAVLNPEQTSYLYFCAKEDFSGKHNFAATYDAHLQNAKNFQQALNKRGIY